MFTVLVETIVLSALTETVKLLGISVLDDADTLSVYDPSLSVPE